MMEHRIPPSFLAPTTMPMQDMSRQPPTLMSQPPFQMPPFNQPPPLYSQPPPHFTQQPVMPTNAQPPVFMPQAPNFHPSPVPFMGVPSPTMVPPPSAVGSLTQSVGVAPHPTDANFTYAFIEQNISKVKANLMNKIDTSKSKVDEYFEKWKVNEPQKGGGSGRSKHSGRKSQDKSTKHVSHHRRRSSSSEIRSVSPENRSISRARSRSRSQLRRSQSNRDSRPRNRYTRSPEDEVKISQQSLEGRDSLNRQNSSKGTLDNSSARNSVESRTSPLNDREIDLLYRDLIRRRNDETRRPPSVISLSPSPPLELGNRFSSLLEQDRPSRLGLQDRSLLENRDTREKLPEASGKRQRSTEYSIAPSISELLRTARRCQQLASQSADLFTAPPANRPPPSSDRSPPLIRLRTPPAPSPPRYDRLPRPSRVQINLSPMRFSRSPSFEIDPRRHLDSQRDLDPRQPSSRRPRSPLRLSPPALRWSQSPSPPPPPPSTQERSWYSRSPEPSEGRQHRHSREHSQGRETGFYGNRADARRHHDDEASRFHGNQDDARQRPLPPSDARHLIRSRDERSMSFSISPSPERRRRARSSSSDFVNPLDLVDNPGIPGEDDYPPREEFY
uniref:Uncharacterized protein n=1 Tax=Cacopsylla melanoneura TaxID=428564 RepID=A0A8D8SP78_9HEMI